MRNPVLTMIAAGFVAGALMSPVAAGAQTFAGKTISIYVGTGPGSTYSRYARLLTEHMGKHISGKPNMVVRNMPGAGGTKAANHLARVAPQDGTALGVPHSNLPLTQILFPGRLKFDTGTFHWLGTITPVSSVVAVWHKAPGTTLEEAKSKVLFMGTTGRGSETYQVPTIMNNLLGTKFKPVAGYKGLGGIDKAIEQGELHGRGGSLLSWTARKADWLKAGKIKYLVQIGLAKSPELPASVPLLMDLAKNDQDREVLKLLSSAGAVGRSLVAPPGVSADRAAELQKAFEATMNDPAFLAAAKGQGLAVAPLKSSEIEGIVKGTAATPKDLADRIRKAIGL